MSTKASQIKASYIVNHYFKLVYNMCICTIQLKKITITHTHTHIYIYIYRFKILSISLFYFFILISFGYTHEFTIFLLSFWWFIYIRPFIFCTSLIHLGTKIKKKNLNRTCGANWTTIRILLIPFKTYIGFTLSFTYIYIYIYIILPNSRNSTEDLCLLVPIGINDNLIT